jgi:hypothetical protein
LKESVWFRVKEDRLKRVSEVVYRAASLGVQSFRKKIFGTEKMSICMIFTPSPHNIFTPSPHNIFPHHHIIFLPHHHIIILPHHHIIFLPHHHIIFLPHHHINFYPITT